MIIHPHPQEPAVNIDPTFVRTTDGRYLVQVPADNQWGFSLCDDDQSWPGGHGVASEWEAVTPDQVPAEEQKRLGWLLESND